jgi:Zn-dependent protease with chaperone function
MNFFEHQARARSRTRGLVLLFLLAVAVIVAAIVGIVAVMLAAAMQQPLALAAQQNADTLWMTALATLAVIGLASLYKSASLRAGGSAVAQALGGTRVPPDTQDRRLRRLRNVVEEMAIAAGTPVPEVYVLEHEAGINAFAAGWSPADAAVAVTRGTLEKLSRDELQGVIAHEFSHVLNGDMRLNIRLMGLLFGILVIAVIGREVLEAGARGRSSSKKEGGAIVLIALAVMLIGYIGLFFGRLIKAGVSRSREYLADSSAVQFTRQTTGITGALKKIAGIDAGSRLQAAGKEEVAHMLFGDGVGYFALFATHPPILDRIRRLDPRFRLEQLGERKRRWNEPGYVAEDLMADAPVTAGMVAAGAGTLHADAVVERAAQPTDADQRYAEAVHAAIPGALLQAAGDEREAWPLLFALLLDPDPATRERQRRIVVQHFGADAGDSAQRLFDAQSALSAGQRLPLASLAFPSLRHQPRERLETFMQTVSALIQADGRVGMFEFCLGSLLRAQVMDVLYPARAKMIGSQKLGHCREPALCLLAVLAQQGHAQAVQARHAFEAGARHLFHQLAGHYAPPAQAAGALSAALRALDRLDAPGKQLLVEAMVKTIGHDHKVTVGEAELLRAVCGCLHCPLPPLLTG